MMRVVIIEDEIRASNRLEKLIKECIPDVSILKKLESVRESVEYFATEPDLDLIFSDIQLADDLSFEVFKQVKISAPIIFTTAYDTYAINAFKTNGIDYLLKPIEKAEIERALEKFSSLTKVEQDNAQLDQVLSMLKNTNRNPAYKSRFLVKVGTQLKSIPVADIQAFYSKDKTNYIFTTDKRSYITEQTVDQLEKELNPQKFFRINRGFLLSFESRAAITAYSNSRLKITLPGLEKELIVVARDKTKSFKKWLGE